MDIKTTGQVDLLYALFLGRLPEDNFVRHENLRHPVLELVRAAIESEEFRQSIIDRFLLLGKLPHDRLPLRILPDVLALANEAGLCGPAEGPATVDWTSVVGRVLSAMPSRAILESVYGEMGCRLIERLAPASSLSSSDRIRDESHVKTAGIASGVEIVADTICRGWLIDVANPDTTLFVKIAVNGSFAKILPASDFRRDVQGRFGGDGRAGFSFQVDRLPGTRGLGCATIDLTELVTGAVLLSDHRVELSTLPTLTADAQLQDELALVRERLERLGAELPDFHWRKLPIIDRLRGARPSDGEADIRETFAQVLQSLNRIEQGLPELRSKRSWALSRYAEVRSTVDLVISPPDVESPATFSIIVLADTAVADETVATLKSALAQSLPACEIFVVVSTQATQPAPLPASGVEIVGYGAAESASGAINNIAVRAKGTYLLLLDAGTNLEPTAIGWFTAAIDETSCAILYSDEQVIEPAEQPRLLPMFRPAFDYDLLLQRNYIGRTLCVRREAFGALGGLTSDAELDPCHDLLLRAVERWGAGSLIHVPQLLSSTVQRDAANKADDGCERTLTTVQAHLDRIGAQATAVPHTDPIGRSVPGAAKILWGEPRKDRISVIILTRDRADLVFAHLSSLHRRTADWDGIEIIVAVNGDLLDEARLAFVEIGNAFYPAKVVTEKAKFNWAKINTAIVDKYSSGDLLVFLNDDMICLTDDWDNRLRGQLSRPDIGVVGGRLLYPNGLIQHAGIAFFDDGTTSHEAMGDSPDDGLYLDRTLLVHNVGAVTGAFLACRRNLFHELSGYDGERYVITSSDADFCVRARMAKKRVVYDPFLTWMHFESVSRGQDSQSRKKQWRAEVEHERWLTRFLDAQLVDLSLNPHLAGSLRPFETFRCATRSRIDVWLRAQRS